MKGWSTMVQAKLLTDNGQIVLQGNQQKYMVDSEKNYVHFQLYIFFLASFAG
jgi:hypothetical protein